jgi:hypothetical protein
MKVEKIERVQQLLDELVAEQTELLRGSRPSNDSTHAAEVLGGLVAAKAALDTVY